MQHFEQSVYDLIVETSTNLPGDVRKAIQAAQEAEDRATRAGLSLSTIATNIEMAEMQCFADLPRYRHADVRRAYAGRRKPNRHEAANPQRDCPRDERRQAAHELRRLADRRKYGR